MESDSRRDESKLTHPVSEHLDRQPASLQLPATLTSDDGPIFLDQRGGSGNPVQVETSGIGSSKYRADSAILRARSFNTRFVADVAGSSRGGATIP